MTRPQFVNAGSVFYIFQSLTQLFGLKKTEVQQTIYLPLAPKISNLIGAKDEKEKK